MFNRIQNLTGQRERRNAAAATATAKTGFVALPMPGLTAEQWRCHQWLYQQALQEAQRVVRPSILERDLLGCWN